MKRITVFILLAAMMLCPLSPASAETDEVIKKWVDKGVLRGDGYGNYNEDGALGRAELITIINRTFDIKNDAKPNYNDLDSGLWYYDEVVAAIQSGYIDDVGDFGGEERVTWLEAVSVVCRATGISAPVNKRDIAIAEKKSDQNAAYSVAVLEKRGICERKSYGEPITKGEFIHLIDGIYTQLFSGTEKEIDFSSPQRKYIDHDFEWDPIGGFPSNWFSTSENYVSVQNASENNYAAISKSQSNDTAELVRYFQPMANRMSFEADLMAEELAGDKVGPDLRTGVFRNETSVLKVRMNNGSFYVTDGTASVKLTNYEAKRWYKLRLDIDLDEGVYDVYIDGVLVMAACSVNKQIFSGHIGYVRFAVESGQTGTLGVDNVSVWSDSRKEEAVTAGAEKDETVTVDFQDMQIGATPPGWVFHRQGSDVYIEQSEETPNKYLVMEKNGYESSGYDRITYNFPKPVSGLVQIEWRAKTGDTSSDWKFFQLENQKLQVVFINDSIYLVDSSRRESLAYTGVAANKWYRLKIVADTSSSTYDFYVNGQKVRTNVSFVAGASQISNIFIQMASNAKGRMYMDDLKISTLGSVSVTPPDGFVTEPRNDVPENSAWMSEFQAKPTENAVQAESMELKGFETVELGNASGGRAVRAAAEGNATATCKFSGESGYYSVKVGYLENELAKDSLHRVYHNGKEIDFWYGQFDDGQLHVRDVKNKTYIETGDVFVLEGYIGEDPTTFDYIDFGEPVEPNFSYGYVVQDEFHAPGGYARSSWETSEAGGSVRILGGSRNFGILDNSTINNVWAKRAFLPQSGVVTSEMDFIYVTPDDGLTMSFRSGETEIVKLVTESGTVYAENNMGGKKAVIEGYAKDKQYKCKIVMDIPKKETKVIKSNGEIISLPMPEVDKADNFYMYSAMDKQGYLKLKSLDVYSGYVINETFKALDADVIPPDWNVKKGSAKAVTTNNADLFDTNALLLSDGSSVSRTYEQIDGDSTVKFYFLMKNSGKLDVSVGNASVSCEGGNIYIKTNKTEKIWDKIKLNQYYNVTLEQNSAEGKLYVYVNNIRKAVLDYNIKHGEIGFAAEGTEVIIDSVSVCDKIEVSEVPKPEKVDCGDYIVGMQTCDLWHEGDHFGWDFVRPYDNRTPLAGYYDDDNCEYVDWEIKWWAEHGINLYFPCWYREFRNTPIREAHHNQKLERFKHSRYSDNVNFAICYENSGRISGSEDFLNNVVTFWIENYFKHPSYLVIDNKPVIGIWSHGLFLDDCGSADKNAELLEQAEEMLRREGWAGAIWITNYNGSDATTLKRLRQSGYDYVYYYGSGSDIETQTKMFDEQQKAGIMDGIMSISQGWGADAWGLSPRKRNLSLDAFRRGMDWAKDVYMPAYKKESLASRMLLFGNWNELAEGHMYVPSKLTGFGYLDQIREVFSNGGNEHKDTVPRNVYDAIYPKMWD